MASNQVDKIIILEDQEIVLEAFRALIHLNRPTAEIDVVSSYDAALKQLAEKEYDLAFLDVDLKSNKNGIDVLEYIRSTDSETKVIMLSAEDSSDIINECINKGASGYIFKGQKPKDADGNSIFNNTIKAIFSDQIVRPAIKSDRRSDATVITTNKDVSLDSLGVRGRLAEVMYYVCLGLQNKTIALKLGIEDATVRQYVSQLLAKFGVSTRGQLQHEMMMRRVKLTPPKTA